MPRNRNQKGQSDTSQLISIVNYIRKRWHLQFKREWYVGFDKRTGQVRRIVESVTRSERADYWWRNPDLLYIHRFSGLIIIEIDGSIHDKKTEATRKRNQQYDNGHIKLIVVNLANLKSTGKTVEEEIDWKMEKLLQEGHIGTEYDRA